MTTETKTQRPMWESNPGRLHGNRTLNLSANLPLDILLYIKLLQFNWNFTDIKVKQNFSQQLRRLGVGSTFIVRGVQPRGNTELILPVKIETKHPVGGPFGHELRSYDGLMSQNLNIFLAIFVFLWKKRPFMVKF